MAGSKPLGKDEPKRFPFSAVHKNSKSRKPHKANARHLEKAKIYVRKLNKAAAEQKARKKLDDPLTAAFTANLEASRCFLHQRAETSITAIHQDLAAQLNNSNNHFEHEAQIIGKSSERFQKPLDQDQLHFVSKDGKSAGTQSLGDRMQKFKDFVATEKAKVDDLGRQWTEINRSIAGLALELVGPEEIDDLLHHLSGGLPHCAIQQDKSFEEEVQDKMNRFQSEMTKVNNAAILDMEACEEEMKDMRRKQMANLLSVMAAEI